MNKLNHFLHQLFFRKPAGFSMVEVMISSAILAGAGLVMIKTSTHFNKASEDMTMNFQKSDIVQTISTKVQNNGGSYVPEYGDDISATVDVLPYYWSENGRLAETEKDCKGCKGRYGIKIRPIPSYSGLYYLTIQLSHSKWGSDKVYIRVISI